MKSSTKSKFIWILIVAVVIIGLLISLSIRREPIPNGANGNYSFRALAPFFSFNQLNSSLDNATAQVIYLGQKPLLHIENMNLGGCPSAYALLAKSLESYDANKTEDIVDLGIVRFPTGNTNYEIPFKLNVSQYPVVFIICNLNNTRLGYASFR